MLVLQGITRKGEQNKDRTLLELGSRGGAQKICIVSNLHLTNFFDLSNIRFESGGPVKCLGPHDVFETGFSNSKGTRRWELICPSRVIPLSNWLSK